MHSKVEEYIASHTVVSQGGWHSTFRNTKQQADAWARAWDFKWIKVIQEKCMESMRELGYPMFADAEEYNVARFGGVYN